MDGDIHRLRVPAMWLTAAKLLSLAKHATSSAPGLCQARVLHPYLAEFILVSVFRCTPESLHMLFYVSRMLSLSSVTCEDRSNS